MALEFKSRTGRVKISGNARAFQSAVAVRKGSNSREDATFSFMTDNKASQPDKLVFWGTGAEIADLLNQNEFIVRTAEDAGLRLEIRWLPITKKGGKKMVIAATKAVAKEVASTAAKAGAAIVSHGVTPAMDVAATVGKLGKTAVKAARGEITIAPNNLELDWEVRIVMHKGAGSPDGIVGLVDRSIPIGKAAPSGHIYANFMTAMGKYSASVENAVMLAKGDGALRYDALLDEDDIATSHARVAAKGESVSTWAAKQTFAFLKDKVERPSSSGYGRMDDDGDDEADSL